MPNSSILIPLLQSTALISPALYTSFTFAYTHVLLPPLLTHSPPKVLAAQWLQAYQLAPVYVLPLILLGTTSNALLYFLTTSKLYIFAALLNASIIPYTALYMEPGINGAGKWKVQQLLGDEDDGGKGAFVLGKRRGTQGDSAREGWKRWAEEVDMKTLVDCWGRTNKWRYVITGVGTVVSAWATAVAGAR